MLTLRTTVLTPSTLLCSGGLLGCWNDHLLRVMFFVGYTPVTLRHHCLALGSIPGSGFFSIPLFPIFDMHVSSFSTTWQFYLCLDFIPSVQPFGVSFEVLPIFPEFFDFFFFNCYIWFYVTSAIGGEWLYVTCVIGGYQHGAVLSRFMPW
jgi:hypothetical protein